MGWLTGDMGPPSPATGPHTASALAVQAAAGVAGSWTLGMHNALPVPHAHSMLTPGAISYPLPTIGSWSLASRSGWLASSAQEQFGLAGLWAPPYPQPQPSLNGWTLPRLG